MFDNIDQLAVDTVRTLSIDAIQAANSGHPGLPMGAAPMTYVLWSKYLKVNPKDSTWVDRDRFVLSAGHGSALLYSMLHLSGYDVTMDDLKNFRQLGSKTPGHPEVHHTDGVEATTGPLGQGFANAVGFAMAEAHLAETYNREGFPVVDHHTYALCGDGDLMEGVSYEAASLAGTLKLGKLVVLYDSNDISLDGPLNKSFNENVKGRFEAMGWQYIRVEDGNDLDAIAEAIEEAQGETEKPSIIEVKTIIGFGAPAAGTSKVHGAPLGEEGIAAAKANYGWEYDPFTVPEEVSHRFEKLLVKTGQEDQDEWVSLFEEYRAAYPELAEQFETSFQEEIAIDLAEVLPTYEEGTPALASRVTSQNAIQELGKALPNFWGGSADLSCSNNTMNKADQDFEATNYAGRNIWYGVREFAMGAALNGILLHGGTRSYVATFFVFSDYLKAAIRVAALSNLPGIYVFTHDSIAVGEDGPTHEPIEQLATFRSMPNVNVIRPADGNEVSAAWKTALEATDRPTVLVLTRQGLPVLPNTKETAFTNVAKGAYVISAQVGDTPEGILIATGSEVELAIRAQKELRTLGHDVSVVSMPSMNLFEEQDAEYIESVLPSSVRNRMSIEMAATFGWERYVGLDGVTIGIDRFGASGNGPTVMAEYGFTVENIVKNYTEAFAK
ncbi:transketolase [Granulicatella balaenopterae]|uniref:Transketolase n=1 Tax=Granulicatella balaenopterae TaxID=137733 RepID=A0A1H9GZB2_9LACT|nr:transketolase [Granulicatella balaenopterae]SEQ55394.1 transketolase [Granulicatella balaenopterae]